MPKRVDPRYWVLNDDGSYTRRQAVEEYEARLARASGEVEEAEKEEIEATDAASDLAEELGVDLASVEGTGKDGKITVGDVRAASDA